MAALKINVEVTEVVGNNDASRGRLAFDSIIDTQAVKYAEAGLLDPEGTALKGSRPSKPHQPETQNACDEHKTQRHSAQSDTQTH